MKPGLKVVVDTNVFISAALRKKSSLPQHIFQAIQMNRCMLVISPTILEEVAEVLNREKIRKLTGMDGIEQQKFLKIIVDRSIVVSDKQLTQPISRDRKDDKFLACAIESQADYLITGDRDLLVLENYQGVRILSPKAFVDILKTL